MHYDAEYNAALGEVVAVFGLLEWNVVYTIWLFDPDFVAKAENERVSAGQVRQKLGECLPAADAADLVLLTSLHDRFAVAVDRRNDVLHGKPCTAPDGAQRLTRHGQILDLPDLTVRISEFAALSDEFNGFFHERRPAD